MEMTKFDRKFHWKELLFWFPVLGYIITGIAVVPLQVAAFILLKPFSLWMYRKISCYFSIIMNWHLTFLILWWSNTNVEIFMDPMDFETKMGKEHSIFLTNHRYEIDMFMIVTVCNFLKNPGNLRFFSKKDIQYLPITGWLWKLQEHIFLERNFDKDKLRLETVVHSLMKHSDAVTLALLPEGTRFTEEKHKASMIVAKKKDLPQLKYHLLPRTRGFVSCINTLKKGKNNSLPVVIYDALFVMESQNMEGKTISTFDLLKGHGPDVKILLRRYPVNNIPEDETECAQWLHTTFQEKDKLMDTFFTTGNFVDYENGGRTPQNFKGFDFFKVPKPLSVLVFIGIFNALCLLGILYKAVYVFKSGDTLNLIAFVAVTIIGHVLFRVLNRSTKIQEGSSYGQVH